MPLAAPRFEFSSGYAPIDGYTIERGIGRGAFGEVYVARSAAGSQVAMKRVFPHLADVNVGREIRGTKECLNIRHDNLVEIFDIKENGDVWIIMEYVNGRTLAQEIDRHPNGLPLETVERWFHGIVSGVAHLHHHGRMHRDLKPSNIFLDFDDDAIKVGDYGLAKLTSESKNTHTAMMGTIAYAAPETFTGDQYNKPVDVYSLGVILYEMVTGQLPYRGNKLAIMRGHIEGRPDMRPVHERAPKYAWPIEKALAKSPDDRWSSVREMESAVDTPTGLSFTRRVYRALTEELDQAGVTRTQSPIRPAVFGANVGAAVFGFIGFVYAMLLWMLAAQMTVGVWFFGFALFGAVGGKVIADAIWNKGESTLGPTCVIGGWAFVAFLVGFWVARWHGFEVQGTWAGDFVIGWILGGVLIGAVLGAMIGSRE